MVPAHVFSKGTQRWTSLGADLAHIAFVFYMSRFNMVEDIVSVLRSERTLKALPKDSWKAGYSAHL